MRRVLKGLVGAALALSLAAGIAYATQPGPHRAVTPGLFGMAQPAPNLYIDAPEAAPAVLAMIAEAERVTAAFFGALRADPTYVVCTTQACRDGFGIRPKGLSLGYQLILLAPTGLDQTIVTHERIHAELHRFMGLRDLIDPRFPAWFDEGLASHISGDTRLNRPANPRDADWIKSARTFRDWGRLHRDGGHHWRDTYGAAATLVAEIEGRLGRDGLLALIHRVAAGADLEDVISDAHP